MKRNLHARRRNRSFSSRGDSIEIARYSGFRELLRINANFLNRNHKVKP